MEWGRRAFLPVALIAGWELASRMGWVLPLFFPAPSVIFERLIALINDGTLYENLSATLLRVVIGVAVGGGLGLFLGLAMGLSKKINAMTDGLVAVTHPLPKIALLPLFLVFFGYGETARLMLVGLSAAFPMIIAARTAVRTMDPLLLEVCHSYGVTGGLRIRRMVLPACRPVVLAGLRLAINTALIVTISVEMLAANSGLGSLLWFGWQTMRLEDIYAVLAIIGTLGYVVNKGITRAEAP